MTGAEFGKKKKHVSVFESLEDPTIERFTNLQTLLLLELISQSIISDGTSNQITN